MSTTTHNSEQNIINTIKEKEYTYIDDLERRELVKAVVRKIQEYRALEFPNSSENNIRDDVYILLNQTRYDDTLWNYHFNVNQLVLAIARPEVSDAIRKHIDLNSVLTMLDRLSDFFEILKTPVNNTDLMIEDIESFPDDYKIERLTEILEEFTERANIAAQGKIKSYL